MQKPTALYMQTLGTWYGTIKDHMAKKLVLTFTWKSKTARKSLHSEQQRGKCYRVKLLPRPRTGAESNTNAEKTPFTCSWSPQQKTFAGYRFYKNHLHCSYCGCKGQLRKHSGDQHPSSGAWEIGRDQRYCHCRFMCDLQIFIPFVVLSL